jgi:hypothetical protein
MALFELKNILHYPCSWFTCSTLRKVEHAVLLTALVINKVVRCIQSLTVFRL